jgi:putative membrane protein
VKGNLFTEQQARQHLSHLGYTGISNLTKDENGVWRGSATKDGNTRTVAVDVKGAVAK